MTPRLDLTTDFTGDDMASVAFHMAAAGFQNAGVQILPGMVNLRGSEILPHCQKMAKDNVYGPLNLLPDIENLLTVKGAGS